MDNVLNEGKDIINLLWEMIKYVKDILVYKSSKKLDLYSEEELEKINKISEKISKERLIKLIYKLSELENDIKWSTQKTIMFQAGIINLCNDQAELGSGSNLEERVEKIEKYLKSSKGVINVQATPTRNYANNMTSTRNNININNNKGTNKVVGSNLNTKNSKGNVTKAFSKNPDEYWPQIINDLKQSGKIVLYTNLISTKAKEINDMTIGIEFPNGMTSFGKTILEKQENIREISNLVSMVYGKEMQIKYVVANKKEHIMSVEENLQNLANHADIPFNIVE